MGESRMRRQIRRADTMEDAASAATIIAQAFAFLPVCQWLVPDPGVRVQTLAAVFDLHVEHALTFGVVDLLTQVDPATGTGAVAGAAVWFDHTQHVPAAPDYEDRLRDATGSCYPLFAALDARLEELHPRLSHHYLAFLAVEPGSQAAGIGSALLAHHHVLLDRHRIPAYLEASSLSSRRLYERHDYTARGPVVEVQAGAPFFPMWRGPSWSDV